MVAARLCALRRRRSARIGADDMADFYELAGIVTAIVVVSCLAFLALALAPVTWFLP